MLKRIPHLMLVALLATTLFGCEDWIDDVEPTGSISSEVALTSRAGFEALLISGYDRLQQVAWYGQRYILAPEALADNSQVTQPHTNRYLQTTNNIHGVHFGLWALGYAAINEMNNVIAKIDDLQLTGANAQQIKNRIKGEAYFIRALAYFDLARAYGYEPGRERAVDGQPWRHSVILRTTPTETVDDANYRPRATNAEVYQQVKDDLQQAATLLQGSGNTKNYANEAAALALLSEVNLYTSDWAAAEAAATAALGATTATLVTDTGGGQLLTAWRASTHPESIFEINMSVGQDGDATTVNGSLHALTDARADNPALQAFSFEVIPTNDLVASHEAGDARLDLYAAGVKTSGGPVTYIRKYTGTTAQNVDRIPVIRVAEVYLNRAEARFRQGNTAGALSDINTLRAARNLAALGSVNEAQILHERRVELAFEGDRWFTLKRLGMDIPKPQGTSGSISYSDYRLLAPLPQTQVDNNPDLVQNPEY